jgi:hypothetical protein
VGRRKVDRVVAYVWLAAIAFLAVYEIYALFTGHDTLSRAVWTAERSEYGPLIPFLAGLVCGHFFWSGK